MEPTSNKRRGFEYFLQLAGLKPIPQQPKPEEPVTTMKRRSGGIQPVLSTVAFLILVGAVLSAFVQRDPVVAVATVIVSVFIAVILAAINAVIDELRRIEFNTRHRD